MSVKTFVNGVDLPASDINTYLANSGLVFVSSTTVGTGVSSVTVTGAFSSTYDNYRIIYSGGVASGSIDLGVRLGSSTSDYYGFLSYGSYTASTALGANDNNQNMFRYIGGADTSYTSVVFDLYCPNLAKPTVIAGLGNLGGTNFGVYNGRQANTTQHTAFTILHPLGTGTLTGGTITVYGYRKA